MYNIRAMPNRKLKFGIACASIVVVGMGIPVWAAWFAQQKTKSG